MNAYLPKIILASSSPRRRELISLLGFPFTIMKTDMEESWSSGMDIREVPVFLSAEKANAVSLAMNENEILIAADTLVFLKDQVIGKPASLGEAKQMLRQLSGNMHEVITGVTLKTMQQQKSFWELSRVYFRRLSDEMIDYYVEKFQPLDKAGSYAIQEWIGLVAIEKIEGCFYNVMGLPVSRMLKEIEELDFRIVP